MIVTKQMKAAVFEKKGLLTVKTVARPQVHNDNDVLIRVQAISICGTDVRALEDPPAFLFTEGVIIGHEFTGVVEEIGNTVSHIAVGDKVVVHPNIWCGKCHYCRIGQTNLCTQLEHIGDRINGGMAEYACVPERMVYKINKSVPSHVACLVEPLACVLNSTESVRIHPDETAVVFGAGPIGLIFLMLYKAAGAQVIVVDLSPSRLDLAKSLGADLVIDPARENLEEIVFSQTEIGADIVADAVGVLLPDAINISKKGGHIVLFGLNDVIPVQLHQAPIIYKELNIHGTVLAKGTFPLAIKLIEENRIPIEQLVTHRLPIEEVKEGIKLMREGIGSKVIIEMK